MGDPNCVHVVVISNNGCGNNSVANPEGMIRYSGDQTYVQPVNLLSLIDKITLKAVNKDKKMVSKLFN